MCVCARWHAGRAPTLQYVRTPFRFELTLSKPLIIGKRRAAQRIIGVASQTLKEINDPPEHADVVAAVDAALVACATQP